MTTKKLKPNDIDADAAAEGQEYDKDDAAAADIEGKEGAEGRVQIEELPDPKKFLALGSRNEPGEPSVVDIPEGFDIERPVRVVVVGGVSYERAGEWKGLLLYRNQD
jgi:hypothetical protein